MSIKNRYWIIFLFVLAALSAPTFFDLMTKNNGAADSIKNALEDPSESFTQEDSVRQLPIGHPISATAKISSYFGDRIDPLTYKMGFHSGIDFSAKVGTPILATGNGTIKRTGLDWNGNGLFIEIDHEGGYSTLYAHLHKLNYVAGEIITKGQILGEVGSSGRSTGPHLHYEIHYKNAAVNPIGFLSKKPYSIQLTTKQPSEFKKILVIRNEGYYYRDVPVK